MSHQINNFSFFLKCYQFANGFNFLFEKSFAYHLRKFNQIYLFYLKWSWRQCGCKRQKVHSFIIKENGHLDIIQWFCSGSGRALIVSKVHLYPLTASPLSDLYQRLIKTDFVKQPLKFEVTQKKVLNMYIKMKNIIALTYQYNLFQPVVRYYD